MNERKPYLRFDTPIQASGKRDPAAPTSTSSRLRSASFEPPRAVMREGARKRERRKGGKRKWSTPESRALD